MKLKNFVKSNDVDFTNHLISSDHIHEIEKEIGVSIGRDLKEYLLSYGYLGFKHIEFYGVNSVQMNESDMIKQTKYLHKYFPKSSNFTALGNLGEGLYSLIDKNDMIYEYDTENDVIVDKQQKLFDYIYEQFSNAE